MNSFKNPLVFVKALFALFVLLNVPAWLNGQTVKQSTQYYWNNSDWVYLRQTIYKYNFNNTLDSTKEYSYEPYGDNIWKLRNYTTYSYNSSGVPTSVIDYYWNQSGEVFVPSNKTSTTYTTGNKPLQIIYSSWDNNSFVNDYRVDYVYNQKMFVTQMKGYSWDFAWINDALLAFSNDASGNPISSLYQELNTSSNVWENVSSLTSVYDGTNVISETTQDWDGSSWTPSDVKTYTYTTGLAVKIKSTLSKTYENNAWVNWYQENYVYTPEYMVLNSQNWDKPSSSWRNGGRRVDEYVLSPTSLTESSKQGFILFPSPARDFVMISGLEGVNEIEIYDEKGRLLERQNVIGPTTRIEVSSLPAGIYFIRADGSGGKKFIKQ